jgi:hypothetical protein
MIFVLLIALSSILIASTRGAENSTGIIISTDLVLHYHYEYAANSVQFELTLTGSNAWIGFGVAGSGEIAMIGGDAVVGSGDGVVQR